MTVATAPVSSSTSNRYDIQTMRDVRVPTRTPGESLSADVHIPVGAPAGPALLTVWPYRKDIGMAEAAHQWFAQRGYASVLVDARGTGSSDGHARTPFDPTEADDAVAAIEWAAEQSWCDGAVGMWGHSYGAIMSLRAAARRPAALKAIVPYQCVLDPEGDLWHPGGARGGITQVSWGVMTLAQQLLPAIRHPNDPAEHDRWRKRLDGEPWILDLFRHGPSDPVWDRRTIDAAAIDIPTLVVAGWRDLMCEGTVRAFEQVRGPKKLVVGPWGHTIPNDSPVAPVDFLTLALRWWDQWLRGQDTGVMDEPTATLYVQGSAPEWRGYTSWPPATQTIDLEASPMAALEEPTTERHHGAPVGQLPTDATVGTGGGSWWLGNPGLPLDQHDDDMRSLHFTGEPLPQDLVVAGRPTVTVYLASDPEGPRPERLVVRLAEVDADGVSTFVTAGVVPTNGEQPCVVVMWPTAYRFTHDRRIRLTVSDADFPRLWPTPYLAEHTVLSVALTLPTVDLDTGQTVDLPLYVPELPTGLPQFVRGDQHWKIERDPLHQAVAVTVGEEVAAYSPQREALIELTQNVTASVRRARPDAAVMTAHNTTIARMATGETFHVTVDARLGTAGASVKGEVAIDGATVFSQQWQT